MKDTAKVALAMGSGMVLGKITGGKSGFWWTLAGLGAIFILNSPNTQKSLSSKTKQVYSRFAKK
jgi:hypothetical protein